MGSDDPFVPSSLLLIRVEQKVYPHINSVMKLYCLCRQHDNCMMNRLLRMAVCFVLAAVCLAQIANANTELWTKTFEAPENGDSYLIAVGQDGSVALVDAYRRRDRSVTPNVYVGESKSVQLYSRSGDLVKEFDIVSFGVYAINYVS